MRNPYNWLLPCLYVVAFLAPRFCVLHRFVALFAPLSIHGYLCPFRERKGTIRTSFARTWTFAAPNSATRGNILSILSSPPTSHRESQAIAVASGSEEASNTSGADTHTAIGVESSQPSTKLATSTLQYQTWVRSQIIEQTSITKMWRMEASHPRRKGRPPYQCRQTLFVTGEWPAVPRVRSISV